MEQDFRIVSSVLFQVGESFYAGFGTSNGQVLVFLINMQKRRLEDVSKHEFNSPVLSMKRVTIKDNKHVLICGLSNGDLVLLKVNHGD